MKAILATLALFSLLSAVRAAPTLQLYFASTPLTVGGNPAALPLVPPADPNANPPQFGRAVDGAAVSNPQITSGRLLIWATGTIGDPDANVWNGIAVNVLINGPAIITGGGSFNVRRTAAPAYRRWETGSDFTQPTFNLIAVQGAGISFPVAADGFDNGTEKALLGYLDFASNGAASEVRFQIGNGGISQVPGNIAFIIFGDDTQILRGNQFGATSILPDAYIGVPEPAGHILLVLMLSVVLRRR